MIVTIITVKVIPGKMKEFLNNIRPIQEEVRKFPGCIEHSVYFDRDPSGISKKLMKTMHPSRESDILTFIARFESDEHFNSWINSDLYQTLIEVQEGLYDLGSLEYRLLDSGN